ncbi:MAG: hypothetical protein AAF413_00565 [Patescibacteria group bacterium]
MTSKRNTDILTLFEEDMSSEGRVQAFERAAEQARDSLGKIATPESVEAINASFRLRFIFNSHGDEVHAAQSTAEAAGSFITFVENANDREVADSDAFAGSVKSAFDLRFNGAQPFKPAFVPGQTNMWAYWRDRGLLGHGSIIAPVDIRAYSYRLLNALLGSDYNEGFLNSRLTPEALRGQPLDELIEDRALHGALVMHSNAVRELTSTRQILGTLLQIQKTEAGDNAFRDNQSDHIRALANAARVESSVLPSSVIYGTAHQGMVDIYQELNIQHDVVFPGARYEPPLIDQFFGAHTKGPSETELHRYASQLVLENILWNAVFSNLVLEHGYITAAHTPDLWKVINGLASEEATLADLEAIHADFRQNPVSALRLIESAGVEFIKVGA